jgi:Xaa-Pro dipeptidase
MMDADNVGRIQEYLASRSIVGALLSNPATVTWLTGYAPPIESGPNPLEAGPALLWIVDNAMVLILSDAEADSARAVGASVVEYPGYTINGPADAFAQQADAVRILVGQHSTLRGRVAVEPHTLPAVIQSVLVAALPRTLLLAVDEDLSRLRAVKSGQEIAKLRRALQLCDLAHTRARQALRPGLTELDLWNQVRGEVEKQAGARVPALVDVVAGPRAGAVGGPPSDYEIQRGDSLILDVVLRLDGYWGDTAGTWFAGEPSAELARAFQAARDALRTGIDAVRPGVMACDLDALLREAVRRFDGNVTYPHHSGHGIGTTYHDAPRIVPFETMRLEPGMVITVEPGIYLEGVGGVRVEDAVLVTTDGCELLTRHLLDDAVVVAQV